MYARLRALWRSTTSKLQECRGDALVTGIFVVLFLAVVAIMALEQWRLMSVTFEATRKVATTITSIASGHLNDSYSPIRDGTSGAFVHEGEVFREIRDTESFYQTFSTLHENTYAGSGSVRGGVSPKGYLYEISNVQVRVNNAGVTSEETTYIVEYTLIVPHDFYWVGRQVSMTKQKQYVRYLSKH